MGVKEHEASGATQEALLENLARLDRGAMKSASEDLPVAKEAVAYVQEECPHHFLVALLVAQQQEARDLSGQA